MPADRYCARVAVSPVRARSKSLAARSRAAGGSCEGLEGSEEMVGGALGGAEGWVVMGSVGCEEVVDSSEEGGMGTGMAAVWELNEGVVSGKYLSKWSRRCSPKRVSRQC